MRKGGKKKYLRKKNIEPIFGKGNEGDEIKKKLTYFKKVDEGDEKKQAKNNIAGKYFFSLEINLFFFRMFFFISQIDCFFPEIGNNLMRAGQKKTHVFFG